MTNNDVLRRIRYIFDLSDAKMIGIFDHAAITTDREQISQWLKKDEDVDFVKCEDVELAAFLNGFIIHKRGAKEGATVENETLLNHNIVFRKLKIALDLQSENVLALFELVGLPLSKHELSAFFRKPDHKNYRECQDQVLRNFLQGLQLKLKKSDNQ
jgi:uncharacterized protein YehS (DUF1456 family)